MPTELERLATLEAEVREARSEVKELKDLWENNRGYTVQVVGQVIQFLMLAALWFKK